jgi:hypothetical protein
MSVGYRWLERRALRQRLMNRNTSAVFTPKRGQNAEASNRQVGQDYKSYVLGARASERVG